MTTTTMSVDVAKRHNIGRICKTHNKIIPFKDCISAISDASCDCCIDSFEGDWDAFFDGEVKCDCEFMFQAEFLDWAKKEAIEEEKQNDN